MTTVSNAPKNLVLVTAPLTEPISLTDAKAHLRVNTKDDDEDIDKIIVAATSFAETILRRRLITQSYDLFLDGFPTDDEWVIVPFPPLIAVTTVKYNQESDGIQTTMPSADYIVDSNRDPGRIALAFDKTWPDTRDIINAVEIRFQAGYGASHQDVPGDIRHAIKIMISHFYEHREPVIPGTVIAKVPDSARALLWHHRVFPE